MRKGQAIAYWMYFKQHIDDIKNWTGASIDENIIVTEDRTSWCERSCSDGAANVRTDDG